MPECKSRSHPFSRHIFISHATQLSEAGRVSQMSHKTDGGVGEVETGGGDDGGSAESDDDAGGSESAREEVSGCDSG